MELRPEHFNKFAPEAACYWFYCLDLNSVKVFELVFWFNLERSIAKLGLPVCGRTKFWGTALELSFALAFAVGLVFKTLEVCPVF